MKIIKNCKICLKEFISYDVGRRARHAYCSIVCKAKGQEGPLKKRLIKKCPTCSILFKVLPCHKNKKYCSKKCADLGQNIWNKLTDGEKIENLRERFYKYVTQSDSCWRWNAATQKGYGVLSLGKYQGHIRAHRLSWILHNGSIPNGMHVLHKCDNKWCVAPTCLFIGTHKDNMIDMRKKGYHKQSSKLSTDDVFSIRALLSQKMKLKEIAKKYNVSSVTISDIKRGVTWKN